MRLAELPCLADLVFVGNPLEEKHSAEANWMDEASKRLPNLKKLDGKCVLAAVCLRMSAVIQHFYSYCHPLTSELAIPI